MFLNFFYLLRAKGISVSSNEWLMLMDALQKGLHQCSLSAFYLLCRSLVVKSETDFDLFDQAFSEFFSGIEDKENLSNELLRWLQHPELTKADKKVMAKITNLSEEEIERLFVLRQREQKKEHNEGRKWIGTGGFTAYGNSGEWMEGIRAGGDSQHMSAYRIAGERRYRDWRTDRTLNTRQFQMALRSLRLLSKREEDYKTELDIDETVRKTCSNAGNLEIQYTYPRKNKIKLIIIMDSGGSMEPYQQLCVTLFRAVSKEKHFQDLKFFYFHNRPSSIIYKTPDLTLINAVKTEELFRNLTSDYRVVLVGDAEMSMRELLGNRSESSSKSGMDWLLQFKRKFPHIIWLHPQPRAQGKSYWTKSFDLIAEQFDMYPLTVSGLKEGMKKLMVNR